MSKKIYANLIGNWHCLNDDPDCTIAMHEPLETWWKEQSHTLHDYNYIDIQFKGTNYRIHPSFIQTVN